MHPPPVRASCGRRAVRIYAHRTDTRSDRHCARGGFPAFICLARAVERGFLIWQVTARTVTVALVETRGSQSPRLREHDGRRSHGRARRSARAEGCGARRRGDLAAEQVGVWRGVPAAPQGFVYAGLMRGRSHGKRPRVLHDGYGAAGSSPHDGYGAAGSSPHDGYGAAGSSPHDGYGWSKPRTWPISWAIVPSKS